MSVVAAWRVVKRKHARTALSGEGARRFGGRWNSPGTAVVYSAESQSLAALEMLVHLDSADLLGAYVTIRVEFDESLIEHVERTDLPRNWRVDPAPGRLAATGDGWVRQERSVVLAVPSVVIPSERNYLLNPRHPEFSRVVSSPPIPFRFDPRLLE